MLIIAKGSGRLLTISCAQALLSLGEFLTALLILICSVLVLFFAEVILSLNDISGLVCFKLRTVFPPQGVSSTPRPNKYGFSTASCSLFYNRNRNSLCGISSSITFCIQKNIIIITLLLFALSIHIRYNYMVILMMSFISLPFTIRYFIDTFILIYSILDQQISQLICQIPILTIVRLLCLLHKFPLSFNFSD